MHTKKRPAKDSIDERSAKRSKSESSYFDLLPDELLQNILAHEPDTLSVCSRFRNVGRSSQFWRSACLARWGEDIPLTKISNEKWMSKNAQHYVFPMDGERADWHAYYNLRSYFCLILYDINYLKEEQFGILIENSELSLENFRHFFDYMGDLEYSCTNFLLRLLPIFVNNKKLGLLSRAATYFHNQVLFDTPDPDLVKRLWKTSREIDVPELQFEFYHSTCKQLCLIQEYDEELKKIFKEIVIQMIQYGAEETEADIPFDFWGWIYPNYRILSELLNKKSPQLQEMIEYLSDIVLESFHETDNELQQTSSIGVLQILHSTPKLPARLIHLALEAVSKESQDVRRAGLVLAVKLLETKQELDLKKEDVIFLFDQFLHQAEQRHRGYYEILRPIYYLISRFPSDFVLQKQIDTFTKKCATVIVVSAQYTTFENGIRDIKFLPKIALVWKERMTGVRSFKDGFDCFGLLNATFSVEKYSSYYIRTVYNALGMKFRRDMIDFLKQSNEKKALKKSHLYAFCGDILYDFYKHQSNSKEIDNIISSLLELFNLSLTSADPTVSEDVEKMQKRYRKLQKKCKKEKLDQRTIDLINGLFTEEPENKPQITLFHSNIKIAKPDNDVVFKAAVKSLIHIAMDLRSNPEMLGTRAKILSCCLEYHNQGTHYRKSKVDSINMLYEDLVPSLSFEQRSFFAKKTVKIVSMLLSRRTPEVYRKNIDFSPLLITATRSMVLNPTVSSTDLRNLIDCLKSASTDIFPLAVPFVSLIGLILSVRPKKMLYVSLGDSTLSNWITEAFHTEDEDYSNDATRVCAMLHARVDQKYFQDILTRIEFRSGIKIEDLKNRCKSLLETSPLDLSSLYLRKFLEESD